MQLVSVKIWTSAMAMEDRAKARRIVGVFIFAAGSGTSGKKGRLEQWWVYLGWVDGGLEVW